MARTFVWPSLLFAALVAVTGCAEKITTPGRCPALCSNNDVQLADTLLTTADSADATARGYVLMNEATFLAASSLDSLRSVVLLRFSPLDSFWVQSATAADTVLVASPPDSVLCVLQVGFRDTTVHPRLVFYRLPARFDTTMTYAQAQAFFADSLVVDTAAVPDTGNMTFRMPTTLVAAPADSGVVSLGIKVIADAPTAVGLASGHSGSTSPALSYFVHGQAPRDTLKRSLSVAPTFAAFAQAPAPGAAPPGELAIGGVPSAHTILHLALPKVAVDSAGIVRATLILTLVRPVVAFPHDSFYVQAYALLRDHGPKSVLYPDTSVTGVAKVNDGQAGTVQVDIARILRLWGRTAGDSLPHVIELVVYGEGNHFGEVDVKGRSAGVGAPQIRVTYVKRYDYGVP